jgi:hypothetical protein
MKRGRQGEGGGPKKGYKQSPSHKKKKARATTGPKNGLYKDGRASYRRVAGAKKGDGKVVHHVNENRNDNRPSNLRVINDPPKSGTSRRGRTTTSRHESITKRARKK